METDYYRRDQERGVTAPDLSKDCSFAEHVVRARGKKTRFTSVSLDQAKIDDFGPALYKVLATMIAQDGHAIVEHSALIAALRLSARCSEKVDRVRAVQALRYATRRKEALVDWTFDIHGIERKEIVSFGFSAVQKYFQRA